MPVQVGLAQNGDGRYIGVIPSYWFNRAMKMSGSSGAALFALARKQITVMTLPHVREAVTNQNKIRESSRLPRRTMAGRPYRDKAAGRQRSEQRIPWN